MRTPFICHTSDCDRNTGMRETKVSSYSSDHRPLASGQNLISSKNRSPDVPSIDHENGHGSECQGKGEDGGKQVTQCEDGDDRMRVRRWGSERWRSQPVSASERRDRMGQNFIRTFVWSGV